jgi:hypothetical protein
MEFNEILNQKNKIEKFSKKKLTNTSTNGERSIIRSLLILKQNKDKKKQKLKLMVIYQS